MSNLSKRLLVPLVAALPLYGQSVEAPADSANNSGVVIAVTTEKRVYKPNEPIDVRAAIFNAGSKPFYVIPNARFGYYGKGVFWPQLKDKNGKEISEGFRVGGHGIAPENADFAESVEQHWILLWPGQFYGVAQKRFWGAKLPPGTYTLRVKYANSLMPWILRGWSADRLDASAKKLKYPAVTGSFISQTVTFRLVR